MPKEKIKGIGGWLLIPIIGLFITLLIILYDLLSLNSIFEFSFYTGLITFFLDMIILILAIVALFSIFNKKKYTPQIMISVYTVNIMISLSLAFLIEDFSIMWSPIIGVSIWIPYFIYSKRVKNTFVK